MVAIAAGFCSLALTAEGRVVGWGYNYNGQANVPVGLSNAVAIAEGGSHSLALTAEGRVVGWGGNDYGQTTIPSGLSNVVAISAGASHSLALTAEGRVVGWGWNDYGQTTIPIGLSNVVAIAAGARHSLALSAGGRVVVWGDNSAGETNIPSGLSNVVAIAAGLHQCLALTAEGQVVGWPSTVPTGLSNMVAIAAGQLHCLALTAEGWVVGWGWNDYGQTTIPSGLSNVVAIAAGYDNSLALTGDGKPAITVQPSSQPVGVGKAVMFRVIAVGGPPLRYQWRKDGVDLADGDKVFGVTSAVLTLTNVQLSELGGYTVLVTNVFGSTTSSVARLGFSQSVTFAEVLEKTYADSPFALAATASSGLPVSFSSDNPAVATVNGNMVTIVGSGTAQITAIQAGNSIYRPAYATCTLVTGGVVGWGWNDSGQTTIPSGLNNVVAIAAGGEHSLALTTEGQVIGWGYIYNGGTNFVPVSIPSGLSNVVAIAAGLYHSLALTAEGRVVGWGYNGAGQTTVPSGLSNVVAIAAGGCSSLALTTEDRVVGWGYHYDGETNIPSGLSNVVAIAAGGDVDGVGHNLALTAEGRVVAWGDNYDGETNVPSGLSNVVAIAAGSSHSLALTAEGRVVGWGRNSDGQTNIPSGLSNVVAVAGGYVDSLALTADSRLVGWGNYYTGTNWAPATPPGGLSNVVAISAGYSHFLALRSGTPPVIAVQPASQSVSAGGMVTFQIWAVWPAGTPPLHYQWRKDGTELSGQTQAWLHLDGVAAGHAGNYAVVVSNFAGLSRTSSVATLTVNCLLNLTSTAGGSVTPNPDLPSYPGNSLVTLTATPGTGYGFIRWAGDATGGTNPLTVSMDTNKNITAVFASTALTIASQGVGMVTKVPDQPFYAVGQQVTVTATAGRWHVFSGWTDGNTNNPRTVTIGESNAYTAVFTPTTPLDTVTIGGVSRLAPVGMPAVVVDGVFILTQSASARGSATVTLATTFPFGTLLYTLDGSEPSFASALYTGPFTVQRASLLRTIAYNTDFTQSVAGDPVSIVILPTLTGLTDGGGSVAIEPPAGDYFSNSVAVVTATPAPGWTFLQWLGDAAGTNPVVNLSMTRNKTVWAVFGTVLNTTALGGGSIVVSPVSPWYPYGSQVRLTAVPATGNYLAFWANAAAGQTKNPLTFTVTNANPTVTAVFASLGGTQTYALTVVPNGRGQVTLTPPGNRFPLNTNVVLQAMPDLGQKFLGWTGDATGIENPLVVTMNSNKVITASFAKRPSLQVGTTLEGLFEDGFRLTLTGEFGGEYLILGSTNLLDWLPAGTVTNTYGTIQFTDPAATNLPARFYRALSVGP